MLIHLLVVFILMYFILNFFRYLYLSKKSSSLKISKNNLKDNLTFNDFLEQTAISEYKQEISHNLGFSFYYPKKWQAIRSKEKPLYMHVKEINLEPGITILRNFNISYQRIEKIVNIDFLFKSIIKGLIKAMDATLEFQEPLRTEETFGIRYKLNYNNPKRAALCCYQAAITDNAKKSLILLTFTAGTRDFSKSKKLFDNISNLVRIF